MAAVLEALKFSTIRLTYIVINEYLNYIAKSAWP